ISRSLPGPARRSHVGSRDETDRGTGSGPPGGGMMANSDFDTARFRLDRGHRRLLKVGKPRKWQRYYVLFPWTWVERLQRAKRISSYRFALVWAYDPGRRGGRGIVLSNILSEGEGLSRRSKWRALIELESLGLVQVERRPRHSPRLILRYLNRGNH